MTERKPERIPPFPGFDPYQYWAEVLSVYDGDTVTLRVDMGLETERKIKIRLYGLNAPEVRGADKAIGLSVRDWLRDVLPVQSSVYIRTFKDRTEKYGRYLARIWVGDLCVNDELIRMGHAKVYMETEVDSSQT